jgi:pimeloyl-ACP methyl ester carboxylesterase
LRLAQAVRQRLDPLKASSGPLPSAAVAAAETPAKLRVLIVHGRDDLLVPVSNSECLAALLPPGCGCELVVMERCGHVPHEERPEELAEIIAEFVERGMKA